MSPAPVQGVRMSHVAIAVSDLDASSRFYVATLQPDGRTGLRQAVTSGNGTA